MLVFAIGQDIRVVATDSAFCGSAGKVLETRKWSGSYDHKVLIDYDGQMWQMYFAASELCSLVATEAAAAADEKLCRSLNERQKDALIRSVMAAIREHHYDPDISATHTVQKIEDMLEAHGWKATA